jgi:hypothetical protein
MYTYLEAWALTFDYLCKEKMFFSFDQVLKRNFLLRGLLQQE